MVLKLISSVSELIYLPADNCLQLLPISTGFESNSFEIFEQTWTTNPYIHLNQFRFKNLQDTVGSNKIWTVKIRLKFPPFSFLNKNSSISPPIVETWLCVSQVSVVKVLTVQNKLALVFYGEWFKLVSPCQCWGTMDNVDTWSCIMKRNAITKIVNDPRDVYTVFMCQLQLW